MSLFNIEGSIYKIEPINGGDDGDIYIGQTTRNLLCQRMSGHRADYKRWETGKKRYYTLCDLFKKYGVENCRIVLLESVNGTKDYLNSREIHYIKTLNCMNTSGKKLTR